MAVPRVTRPFTGPDQGQLSPYLRANVSPDDFGAGAARGLAQAGEQLFRAGNAQIDRQIRDQEIANESQVRDALTQYKQATIDIWGQYGSTSGKTAVDGWTGYLAQLKSAQQNILGSIQNENVKKAALSSMESWRLNMFNSGQTHKMREERQWGVDSSRAEQSQAIATATLMRNDFAQVHAQVNEGLVALARESRLNGDTPEIFASKERAYKGQAYATVIDNLIETQPFRAEALFRSVRNQIDPVSQAKIEESLKPKVMSARADFIVQGIISGNQNPKAEEHITHLMQKGWSRTQAAAIVGNLQQESGLSVEAVGDSGTAFGLAQWRGERFENLKRFAQARGLDARTKEAQLDFIDHELRTSEKEAGDMLANARNLEEATAAFISFERPRGWTKANPRGGDAFDKRLRYAASYVGEGRKPGKDLLTEAYEATKDDPELQRIVMSRMQQSINAFQTATAQNRARLNAQAGDVKTALLAGQNVTIPETEIRMNFDADVADRMVGELNVAKVTGQAVAGLMLASPEEVANARTDISTGQGPLSDMLRNSYGYQGTEADKAKETATRIEFQAAFDRALAQRDRAISADPALYVQRDETVKAALTVLQRDRSPEGWKQYVIATNASQERLGIPESNRRLLTDQQKQNMVDAINRANPKGAADFLEGLRNQVGDEYWPQVFGELSRGNNGIPTGYIALGTIDPNDAVGRTTLAEVLQNEIDNKGAARKAAATLGKDVPNTIAQNVDEAMADYLRTFTYVDGGTALATGIIESAKLLAWHWAPTLGEGKAAERAVATMAGMYDLQVSEGAYVARAPKGMGSAMEEAADAAKDTIDPRTLVPLADRSTLYSPEEVTEITLQNARLGVWVTSPTADGWTLMGANNEPVMRWVGRGRTQRMVPVTVPYQAVEDGTAPRSMRTLPQGLDLMPTRPAVEDPRGRPYR